MLKLPNSFCRYLKVACESVSYIPHARQLTYLTCIGEPCCSEFNQRIPKVVSFLLGAQQKRLYASGKKKHKLKQAFLNSNEANKSNQMSESLKPTLNHETYGGDQFDVSTNSDNFNKWQSQFDESKSQSELDTSGNETRTVPPDFRVWESAGKKGTGCDAANGFRFKVLSYNVLAQYLLECHPYLYRECSPRNLKWKVRAARLFDEITNLSPDILCLQEVQATHLNSFYSKFESLGYSGIFKQKTGHRHDGCAIYFKDSLFEMKEHMSVEFYQPELPILNRDNIGVMVKLVPRALPACPVVVATTHLLYNPKRTDVRLAQIQVFLAEIDRFAYYSSGSQLGHLPIILTGDLNSTPDSAVIKLLDRGYVSASPFRDSSDWKRIGVTDNCQHLSVYLDRQVGKTTDNSTIKIFHSEYFGTCTEKSCGDSEPPPPGCEYNELFNSGNVGHSLRLTSVYEKTKPGGGSEASTYQDYWVTVDYIYFSSCSNLKLVERLRLPTAEECEVLGTLPNDVYGSDHLALAATFELRPVKASL
ncbi:unnamed protein product [Chilo suppressalis]|uniref:Endonuclease/exonuclease/phosphatase domain-containing protein n=1 Tax=Chilo suppressalis TaxID=168631 RepID=A0ABN8EC19_CHISP|nr:hypothetical protein evm_003891 [Chilo suppressalis]CAH0684780.1 unnamed protein product [Chilo suppressalis]